MGSLLAICINRVVSLFFFIELFLYLFIKGNLGITRLNIWKLQNVYNTKRIFMELGNRPLKNFAPNVRIRGQLKKVSSRRFEIVMRRGLST